MFDRVSADSRRWLDDVTAALPHRIRTKVRREWERRQASTTAKNSTRSANIYVRRTVQALTNVRAAYPFRTLSQLYRLKVREAYAADLAASAVAIITETPAGATDDDTARRCYEQLARFCLARGIKPAPYWNTGTFEGFAPGINRMKCPVWYLRQLNILRDRCIEHINLAAGMVGTAAPYISKEAFNEWQAKQAAAAEWLDTTEIESDAGDVLTLAEAAAAGVSNPDNRRTELMVRLRGLEELATGQGKEGWFLTITCPSKFHPNSPNWNHKSPRAGQRHLCRQWAKLRAWLKRRNITMSFCRVAEPHKDGCPHWHILAFVDPEFAPYMLHAAREYALQVNGDEPGATKHRFTAEFIDPAKGSAVGYIAKYISKNINGVHMEGEIDDESKMAADKSACRCRAWASRWGIRQFQFGGTGASVSLWREVRRLRDVENLPEAAAPVREAACHSRWAAFVGEAQAAHAKVTKEVTEMGSHYGNNVIRPVGVTLGQIFIATRYKRWRIKKRGSASPWSTTNKCTEARQGTGLDRHLALLGIDPGAREALERGSFVTARLGETKYALRGGQLREFD
ncbi:replication endonuclease [Ferrimonas balearica]|uniref:replication endonuclease n=1 Tax=Ferrimonas balearica TaxID=44012 RepID=UPI001F17B0C8|nr:replication endonuclease [Ferrimonas balearica]MBY6095136.1 replication endonuclease [Ferrimonas balearica]